MVHRLFALLAGGLLPGGSCIADLRAAAAPQPGILAPVAISGPAGVDCLAFAPDGAPLYFDQQAGGRGFIKESHCDGNDWSAPVDLGDAVDHYQPGGSHLGPDGRSLHFTSNLTLPAHYPRSPAQARADLARLRAWDNGNNHIWHLSLAPWLAPHHAA